MNKNLEALLWSPVWLIMWAIQIAIKTPAVIIGLFLQPLMWKHRNTFLSDLPWYVKWLANPEDQWGGLPGYEDSLPPFWKNREGVTRWSHWKYHAIRNPADFLRQISWLQCPLEPKDIKYITNELLEHYEPRFMEQKKIYYYACWNGPYCGIKLNYVWSDERYFEFKFGFRIHPRDVRPETIDWGGTRAILGASMASKFLPYRKW